MAQLSRAKASHGMYQFNSTRNIYEFPDGEEAWWGPGDSRCALDSHKPCMGMSVKACEHGCDIAARNMKVRRGAVSTGLPMAPCFGCFM